MLEVCGDLVHVDSDRPHKNTLLSCPWKCGHQDLANVWVCSMSGVVILNACNEHKCFIIIQSLLFSESSVRHLSGLILCKQDISCNSAYQTHIIHFYIYLYGIIWSWSPLVPVVVRVFTSLRIRVNSHLCSCQFLKLYFTLNLNFWQTTADLYDSNQKRFPTKTDHQNPPSPLILKHTHLRDLRRACALKNLCEVKEYLLLPVARCFPGLCLCLWALLLQKTGRITLPPSSLSVVAWETESDLNRIAQTEESVHSYCVFI